MEATNQVLSALKVVIGSYLEKYPRITLNGLSKRCAVSEPTLRRIMSNQVKTEPTVGTVLEILSSVSKEKNISELMDLYPGALADKLKEGYGIYDETKGNAKEIPELTMAIQDELAFLVYKLSANESGVSRESIQNNLGNLGLMKLDEFVSKGLVFLEGERYFSKYKSFALPNESFVKNFKAVANFINTGADRNTRDNLFYNLSNSLNEMGRRELLKVQRLSLKKMDKIFNEERFKGDIPVFLITAIDTFEKNNIETVQ